jgi:hypothetical protein
MLITKEIEITIVSKNINHFNEIGYNVKYGDIIKAKITDLSKNSKIKINVICDICGKEKYISYCDYLKQNESIKIDTCIKCKTIKTKKTNLSKYGVEHITQLKEFKDVVKKTMIEKYGVENAANSIEIQEKKKKTIKEIYGVEYITQSKEFKDKAKKTKKEKYGNENFINFDRIKKTKKEKYNDEFFNNIEKSKQTNLEKYGVENVSQIDNIKLKKKETSLKNYGKDHPLKTFEIMEKLRNTNIDKLGVPYPTMSKEITNKIFDTNVKNNRWIKYEDRDKFYNYYLLACKFTLKNKKDLLENWNGYDYYTGEYILYNFNLDSNDKNYPTIDHKNSIRYGFDNNISAEEISKIDNLCITTRSNNSSKGEKIEEKFNIYYHKLNQMK